jgi:glycosyltransferase involved in cell wall biosynthesis
VKLTVLMPVFNEAGTLEEAVRRVQSVRFPKEIIAVDDGSTDGSRDNLKRLEADAKKVDPSVNDLARWTVESPPTAAAQ